MAKVPTPTIIIQITLPAKCKVVFLSICLFTFYALGGSASASRPNPFLSLANDRTYLEKAIAAAQKIQRPRHSITGITVPHHLLAADLIAQGFWSASSGDYDRVILLAPDHFRKNRKPFSVAQDQIETVYGPIAIDSASKPLASMPHFDQHGFSEDHGILALAPFIKRFFPNAKIIAILASTSTTQNEWLSAAQTIGSLVNSKTLVIQSTDYSHYLPRSESTIRDQESLNVISSEDPWEVNRLSQPGNLDSKAAQFLQMYIQRKVFNSRPDILNNKNSSDYNSTNNMTTSYIVVAYSQELASRSSEYYSSYIFAGDIFLGRFFSSAIDDDNDVGHVVNSINALTGRNPVVANLEGVLLSAPLLGADSNRHWMPMELASPILQQLHVVGAGLANNHAFDLGEDGFRETQQNLRLINIRPLAHGQITDFGAFRILPLTFLPTRLPTTPYINNLHDLDFVCTSEAPPPLIAFVHWGAEFTNVPSKFQEAAAERLAECGVSLVIGAHSHRASTNIHVLPSGHAAVIYSLGNLLFDQRGPRVSGALLDLKIFRQGTFAVRLIPVPNVFETLE